MLPASISIGGAFMGGVFAVVDFEKDSGSLSNLDGIAAGS